MLLTAAPASAGSSEETRPTNETIRTIFRVLLGKRSTPQRCGYGLDWDRYPVPGWLAKETLGWTSDADIPVPEPSLTVKDVLDSGKQIASAFCSDKDFETYLDQRAVAKEPSPAYRTEVTFPVFSSDRKTAIVVIANMERGGLFRLPNGVSGKRVPELAVIAVILRESKDGWTIVREETLGIT